MIRSLRYFPAILVTLGLAWALSQLTIQWSGRAADTGQLTVQTRLTKNVLTQCRAYTAEEIRTIPVHMRGPQHCERTAVAYRQQVTIDSTPSANTVLTPQSTRGDHPLHADQQWFLTPGLHHLQVTCEPMEQNNATPLAMYQLERDIAVTAGHIIFVTLDEESGTFLVSE